ncbi:MAG: prephenate dehydrogenase [Burkholderiales bacterium]
MFFERVAVVGVGLIGGSFGLALKAAKRCGHVVGVGRSVANMNVALELGAIDSFELDAGKAVAHADLVLVATPVAQFSDVFNALKSNLKPGAILTDGGSTKRDVVAAARAALGERIAQFVPAHPIAGAEKSGAGAARADLFRDRRVVLTPLAENSPAKVQALQATWQALGAKTSTMDPQEHDAVFAAVSHLPHVLAYALVSDIAQRPDAAKLFGYAAGGFRDFTRIASSHPEMWRDICTANGDQLLKEISSFTDELQKLEKMLRDKDAKQLEKLFTDARAARERWLNGSYE